jgi:hypothetical protein
VHSRTKLLQVVQEISTAEQEYEFLKEDSNKYEAEMSNKRNAGLDWKGKNICFYDARFGREGK